MRWPKFDRSKWHDWFAWYPINVDGLWVWWETVEVRLDHCNEAGNWWEYRLPASPVTRPHGGGGQ